VEERHSCNEAPPSPEYIAVPLFVWCLSVSRQYHLTPFPQGAVGSCAAPHPQAASTVTAQPAETLRFPRFSNSNAAPQTSRSPLPVTSPKPYSADVSLLMTSGRGIR
jgi:hypothetical protein